MKNLVPLFVLLIIIISTEGFAQHHGGGMMSSREKSPAIAALLSIQPLPIAFGNFYSGDWERGIIYTTAELALFIPAAVLLGHNNWGFGMHNSSLNYSDDRKSWSSSQRTQFYYLLAGYVIVKIISAFDAGFSVENYNRNLAVIYNAQNKSTMLSVNIPVW